MQELWRLGVGWDAAVPETIDARWRAWCRLLEDVRRFKIARCYAPTMMTATEVQLHCFADASEEAFAAVVYWRIKCGEEWVVSFVAGKTRCAPLKQLSVPRLELQAAVLATRLINTVREYHSEIVIKAIVCWTDSQTVMQWLQSTERRFRPFVAPRVAEVLDGTRASWWRWIPTKENVADDATRCKQSAQYDPDSRWLRGPAILRKEEAEWPVVAATTNAAKDDELPEEIRSRFVGAIQEAEDELINVENFSSFIRLKRTVAWMLRFVSR